MNLEDVPNNEQLLEQKQRAKPKSGFKRFLNTLLLLISFSLIVCIYWFYFNVYAEGERTGVLIKISHKGNFFKTDEGEMWLSCRVMTNPEKFYFSVKSDSLAKVLVNLQDECVQLTYSQYRRTVPWRGKTTYIITGVNPIQKN